jgi:hypothetical protein
VNDGNPEAKPIKKTILPMEVDICFIIFLANLTGVY